MLNRTGYALQETHKIIVVVPFPRYVDTKFLSNLHTSMPSISPTFLHCTPLSFPYALDSKARIIFFRGPIGMPKAFRSLSVICLRAAMSTSSAWKVIEYFSSPRELRKLSSGLSAFG
uniref:Uncharacterized protein n=1 Tax=Zea mays TaxID=4577 RepID=C0PMG6_MAIZE|nr:unknown [Zea mays]